MYKIIIYSFLFILSISDADGEFRFDYTYSKDAEGWLKLHRVPATFRDAFLRCNFEGAVLASPLNERLHKVLKRFHPKSPSNCGMYTGVHATISHGDYTSIEGIPLARISANWSADEPDNYRDQEDCLIMTAAGALADVRCNETFPYVCYKKKTKNLVISECGTSDPGYKLDATTGSCYKFHTQGLSWRRAQMVCLAEGGHLAIINSQAEANALKNLFAQYPTQTIRSVYKDSVSLGFKDWGEGFWFTVHGQSLQEAGYSLWSGGQPDNASLQGQGQHCGAMFRSGLLDDIWCDDVNIAFVCEKSPESLSSF